MTQGATTAPSSALVSPSSEQGQHITVLLDEAVDALNIKSDGTYIDCTFGRGGHSRVVVCLRLIATWRRMPQAKR